MLVSLPFQDTFLGLVSKTISGTDSKMAIIVGDFTNSFPTVSGDRFQSLLQRRFGKASPGKKVVAFSGTCRGPRLWSELLLSGCIVKVGFAICHKRHDEAFRVVAGLLNS